jgi:hypothetical protein
MFFQLKPPRNIKTKPDITGAKISIAIDEKSAFIHAG